MLPPSEAAAARGVRVYDAGFGSGWQDFGWGVHEIAEGSPARINMSAYGGFILRREPLSDRFGGLSFRVLAPFVFGTDFLEVRLGNGENDQSMPAVPLDASRARQLPTGWVEFHVPWTALNPGGLPFDRIVFHARKQVGQEWVQFDEIALTDAVPDPATTGVATAGSAPIAKPVASAPVPGVPAKLAVDCRAAGHAISPYVYGIAGNDADETPTTARRWGGNPRTRYNWQLNADNKGLDWFFENAKTDDYKAFLLTNKNKKLLSALTIPTIGWIAKDASSYGFPVAVYGKQEAADPYKPDAGNGLGPGKKPIEPKAATQTSVAAPPEAMQKWVETIVQDSGQSRSVGLYILDNEPNLWSTNHRDVHPTPLTYDELLDRTIRYGSAIRKADPGARIAGPAEWGWTNYFFSAEDSAKGVHLKPDRLRHGDVPLIPWYLKQLREHEKKTGTKVLDVLDVHYYPQAQDVYGSKSDAATAALRIRSTRSLWDPSYRDESWIADNVRLLPRLKEWVAQNYPGLGISIGEYNFGGEDHISGALAQAEALGRFGVAGIDYAFYWFAPPKGSPAAVAFRAYRDFDGNGGHFLSRSVDTRMTSSVSLFASRDESNKRLVLVALNLDPSKAANAEIAFEGCGAIAKRRKFDYFEGASGLTDRGTSGGDKSRVDGALSETLAPYSINVFDIELR